MKRIAGSLLVLVFISLMILMFWDVLAGKCLQHAPSGYMVNTCQ